MDNLIRLASGQLSAYDLLSNDAYLVRNWTRTDDMQNTSFIWSASQPDKGLQAEFVQGLGLATGGYYGGYSGQLNIFVATPQMREYLFDTFMNGSPICQVTAYLHIPNKNYQYKGMTAVYGEMLSPIASNAELDYTRFNNHLYHTLQFSIRRATILPLTVWGNGTVAWGSNTDTIWAQEG